MKNICIWNPKEPMFLDKLPKSMREEARKKFNFDNI